MKAVVAIVFAFVFAFVLALILAWPTQLLLNYVFSDSARVAVFGVAHVGIWRALWTGTLAGFLFKSTSAKS